MRLKASLPWRAAAFPATLGGIEWLGGGSSVDQTVKRPAPGWLAGPSHDLV